MKIYNEMTYEEIGDILYKNIDDTYTRNLALHILEDREDVRCDYLGFKEENTNLKQALNEIREYVKSDKALIGCDDNDKELFLRDYACSNYILQIIYKAIGDEN